MKNKHLEKTKILAEANMRLAGVPALHITLEKLLKEEKYEELNIMKLAWQLYKYETEVMKNSEIIQKTKRIDLQTKCRDRNVFLSPKIWELKNKLQKYL